MNITEMSVTVELPVAAPMAEVWDVLADLSRVVDWSPECVRITWEDGWDHAVPGARFRGHNRAGDWEWDVTCVVTEVRRPILISWVVLGDDEDVNDPSSTWRYILTPRSEGGTLITQSFVHGPGGSHLTKAAAANPEWTEAVIDFRQKVLEHNVIQTLDAMATELYWHLDRAAIE